MKAKRLIPIAVTAACAAGVLPAASASAATDVAQAASENWSGYVAGSSASGSSNTQFKSVSGSWVQPPATCSTGQSYSAFWVGLGGSGQTDALEQDGTEVDCSTSGSPSYFAWYELVPQAPVRVNMAIHPGDHISSQVTVEGTNVSVSLSNATTGGSFTKTLQMSNPDVSSAEWIAEAPSSCSQGVSDCTPLSLADFGTVDFTNATATASDGHTGPISDPEWSPTAVTLSPGADSSGFGGGQFVSQSGSAGATPSSLSSDGSSFSVAWSANGGSASDTGGAAGDGGDGYSSGSGYGDPYGDGTGTGTGGGYGGYGGGGYIYLPGGYVLTY
ncbi:MAG: G1 family glutamic endopeptidase [Solirubrobacteraceae bacterium]